MKKLKIKNKNGSKLLLSLSRFPNETQQKRNKSETTTRCRGFRALATHAPRISRAGASPHVLQLYQDDYCRPTLCFPFPLVAALGVLCYEALEECTLFFFLMEHRGSVHGPPRHLTTMSQAFHG